MSKQFNKTIGNINELSDFHSQNATIDNLTVTTITAPNVVTSTGNITTNNIVVGNNNDRTVKDSTFSLNQSLNTSSNVTFNQVNTLASNIINGFDNFGYGFVESTYAPNQEYGMRFTTSGSLSIKSLRHYFTTNQSTSNVIRLWGNTGTLLTSASTTAETTGWNSTSDINYTIPAGTYTISFTLNAGAYYPISTYNSGLPYTLNGITVNAVLTNNTGGQFPNINLGANYLVGLDLSMITGSLIPIMCNGSGTTNSTLVPLGHNLSPYRMLWGQVNGTTGALNYGSNGFKSVTRTALGMFDFVFQTAFIYPPSIISTIIQPNSSITNHFISYAANVTQNGFSVYNIDGGVAWAPNDFYVQVIGI